MSVSSRRTSYHHGDLPRALVVASMALIEAHGAAGFSLREAARRAGVDPAAVYRHFADKAALLREVAVTGFAVLAEHMAAEISSADQDPVRVHHAAAGAYVGFAVANPELFRVMFGPYGAGGPDRPARGSAGVSGQSPYDLLVDVVERLRRAGLITADVNRATVVAWSGVHGLAYLLVENVLDPGIGVQEYTADVAGAILRGLR